MTIIKAFISFDHFVDEHDSGQLTDFAEKLGHEVKALTGRDFAIIMSGRDIKWGENEDTRIIDLIDSVTFFIPVITPSFFGNETLREQVATFARREEHLGRTDLVLPVIYIGRAPAEERAKWEPDEVGKVVFDHKPVDCRELRHTALSSFEARKAISNLAAQIGDALDRMLGPLDLTPKAQPETKPQEPLSLSRPAGEQTSELAGGVETRQTSDRVDPDVFIVDPSLAPTGDKQHNTITAAVQQAAAGSVVFIRPGTYQEHLVINKPLSLIGDGPRDTVVIEALDKPAIAFDTLFGRVTNLTVRQTGTQPSVAIDILQGYLYLEDCNVTSDTDSCVAIRSGADPHLGRNRIFNGKKAGIVVYDNGRGTIENNEIMKNSLQGVAIRNGANPTIRQNVVQENELTGVLVFGGEASISQNEITRNGTGGVQLRNGCNPSIRYNRIHDNEQSGIEILEESSGTIEQNSIFGNARNGVLLQLKSNPKVIDNRIYGNTEDGVEARGEALGLLEGNDIYGNHLVDVRIREGSDIVLRRNKIHDGGGVIIETAGKGLLEGNEIAGCVLCGVEIREEANPTLRDNDIHSNQYGVYVDDQGQGLLENNHIHGNKAEGICIEDGGNPRVIANRIAGNEGYGISIRDGAGIFDRNSFENNQAGDWNLPESILTITPRPSQE